MSDPENFGAFLKENKGILRNYFETRLVIFKLSLVRLFSKLAGQVIWIIISLFLAFLLIVFLGITAGYWLSEVTGSYVKGFGIVTLIILAKIIVISLWRKKLFVNPILRNLVRHAVEESASEDED